MGRDEVPPNGSLCNNLYPTMRAGLSNPGSVDALGGWGGVCEFPPQVVGNTLQMSLSTFFGVHSFHEVCVQDRDRFKWEVQSCKEVALEKHSTPSTSVSLPVI